MKNIFLIDFENVVYSFSSIPLLQQTKEKDVIYLFISNASLNYIPKMMSFLQECKAKVILQYCKGTCKNNMDIYISGIMGNLLHDIEKSDCLYIVSQDHGYDGIISYFSDKYHVERICPNQEISSNTEDNQKISKDIFKEIDMFCKVIAHKPENEIGKYKSHVHNLLVQKYKEDGKEYYKFFLKKCKMQNIG